MNRLPTRPLPQHLSRPPPPPSRPFSTTPQPAATLLRRPHRPYQFTALIASTTGAMTLSRTTSPVPIFRAAKDVYNHPLWNPSSRNLRNVEEDEAGRLRGFRARFGRGWDIDGGMNQGGTEEEEEEEDGFRERRSEGDEIGEGKGRGMDMQMGRGDLTDLISADVGLRDGRQVRTRKREVVEEEKGEEKGGKKKGKK